MIAQDSNPSPSKYGKEVLTNLLNTAVEQEMYEEAAEIHNRMKAEEQNPGGVMPWIHNLQGAMRKIFQKSGQPS